MHILCIKGGLPISFTRECPIAENASSLAFGLLSSVFWLVESCLLLYLKSSVTVRSPITCFFDSGHPLGFTLLLKS